MTTPRTSLSHWGAFAADIENEEITGVHPFSKDARPSPLIQSIPSFVHSESRIRQPMVREGFLRKRGKDAGRRRGQDRFVAVSWEEALDLASSELQRVRTDHGPSAIFGGSYGWSSAGRVNHARTLTRRFMFSTGGCVDQVTNYSFGTAMVLLPHVVGGIESVGGPVTDWKSIAANTKLMLMFGGASIKNSHVTTGGAGSHEYSSWLRHARASGVQFVCVSPVATDAPDFLDAEWLPIRPGADTALILALAHTISAEGKEDREFLARYAVGYDAFRSYLHGETDGQPKDAEWAAPITQIDAETIRDLARRLSNERSMVTATWSLQRADHGEQPYWSLIALAAMLGHIGLPGGGFGFGYGSINGMGNPRPSLPTPTMESGRNPLGLAIPVARVTDLLSKPGEVLEFNGKRITYPDIKLVYWAGGNPFHHHQDLARLDEAWQRPETIIVHEISWTATARRADIVFPATTAFERNDIGSSPRDRFIMAMPQLIRPVGQARNDYDIFADLADRLGDRGAFTEGRSVDDWVQTLYEVCRSKAADRGFEMPGFQAFWAAGHLELPRPQKDFVLFEAFRRDPDANPLKTPSGKIEIFSETVAAFGYDDCPGHPVWREPKEWLGAPLADTYPLHLVSNQPATRLHSQLDNGVVSLESKIRGHEPIWVNPADAAARNIGAGDTVRVYNARGSCLAGVVLTDNVRPSVVQLATGAWYDPVQFEGAVLDKHGNPNVLSRDEGTSRLGQGPSSLSVLVEIEKWDRDAEPVSAFVPPEILAR